MSIPFLLGSTPAVSVSVTDFTLARVDVRNFSYIFHLLFLWSLFRLYDATMPNILVTYTRIVNIVIYYLVSLEEVGCWRVSNICRNYIAETCYFLLVRRKFTTQPAW